MTSRQCAAFPGRHELGPHSGSECTGSRPPPSFSDCRESRPRHGARLLRVRPVALGASAQWPAPRTIGACVADARLATSVSASLATCAGPPERVGPHLLCAVDRAEPAQLSTGLVPGHGLAARRPLAVRLLQREPSSARDRGVLGPRNDAGASALLRAAVSKVPVVIEGGGLAASWVAADTFAVS